MFLRFPIIQSLNDTILDVGSGSGDIAKEIIKEKETTNLYLLDLNKEKLAHGKARIKNHKKSIKTLNGITLQEKVLPKSLRVKELVNGLYEIEGYDYLTISKVNKRIRENTYNGKFLDLKNGIR